MNKRKLIVFASFYIVIVFIVLVPIYRKAVVHAQPTCCNPPPMDPTAPKFPAYSEVTVTISSALTLEERERTSFPDLLIGIITIY